MKNLIARHHRSIREIVKFSIVGILNTAVDVAIFFVLTHLGMPYVAAQAASYSCGAGNSYVLNKRWTFRACGLSCGEMLRFTVVNLASLGISVVCLRVLHDDAALGLAAAKGWATGCALVANFLGNKLWVFR